MPGKLIGVLVYEDEHIKTSGRESDCVNNIITR